MQSIEVILAAMLFLMQPGKSIYSQVVVEESTPPPCTNPYHLLCLPPRWSAPHNGYIVAESWEQGLRRYGVIAEALRAEVYDKKRLSYRKDLWRYTLAMVFAESGFRKDVHEGVGSASRGDCSWRTGKNGKRERVPGSCKSHCLAQIMLGPKTCKAKTAEGYGPYDLVGTDLAATRRCLSVAVRIIDGALQWCSKLGPRPLSGCIVTRYAGGGIKMNDKRVIQRIRLMNRVWNAPTTLEKEVLMALGGSDGKEVQTKGP